MNLESHITGEKEHRDKFLEEMFIGNTKAQDKNYKFNLEPWKERFQGMPVLLLTPGIDTKARFKSKFNIAKGNVHPLGVGLLGTILKKAGAKVRIIDMAVECLGPEELLAQIRDHQPYFIGVSCWSPSATEAFILADIIKPEFPNIPLIYGGPHITSFQEGSLKRHTNVDIVAVGEGEGTILELAEHYFSGNIKLKDILGIGYREDGKIMINPPRPRVDDLDDLPTIDRSFYKKDVYIPMPHNYKRLPVMSMVTSRGCPYKCTFCFESGRFGLKFRNQSVESVINEIKYLQKDFGIKEINFWDDIFLVNKKWIYAFCDALEREKINIAWTCESRVDHVTPDLLKRIAKAGCYSIFYGFESGVDELLQIIKKGTTVEQNRQAAVWAAEAGISIRASFILGLPGETPELGQQTVDFALSLPGLLSVQFNFATPFPGTEMYENYKESDNYDEELFIRDLYSKHFTAMEITYVAPGYKGKEHELHDLSRKAYRRFYFRPSFIWRHLKTIRSFNDIQRLYDGLKFAIGIAI